MHTWICTLAQGEDKINILQHHCLCLRLKNLIWVKFLSIISIYSYLFFCKN